MKSYVRRTLPPRMRRETRSLWLDGRACGASGANEQANCFESGPANGRGASARDFFCAVAARRRGRADREREHGVP